MIQGASSDATLLTQAEQSSSLWQDAWRRLRKNKLAVAGGAILILLMTVALLTPWLAPYSYETQDLDLGATPPSAEHWLEIGRAHV